MFNNSLLRSVDNLSEDFCLEDWMAWPNPTIHSVPGGRCTAQESVQVLKTDCGLKSHCSFRVEWMSVAHCCLCTKEGKNVFSKLIYIEHIFPHHSDLSLFVPIIDKLDMWRLLG